MKNPPYQLPKPSIKMWAEDDRPREKLLLKGKASLSDAELLAILIGTGYRNKSALDLAQDVLDHGQNDWHKISKMSAIELMKIKGLGPAKAINIISALEIGNRKAATVIPAKTKVRSSKMIYDHLKQHFSGLPHEEFYVVYLNFANEIIETADGRRGHRGVPDGGRGRSRSRSVDKPPPARCDVHGRHLLRRSRVQNRGRLHRRGREP